MTFCLGLVRETWALVAADTRVRWREGAEEDQEPWQAPVVAVEDGGAKVFALRAGWLVGGPYVSWRDGALQAMQQALGLPEALTAYRAFAGPAMRALEAESPGEAEDVRRRQSTILVVRTATGFAGAHVFWAGVPVFNDCRAASALCPGEISPPTMTALLDAYQGTVGPERVLRRVVRATAALFAAVYARTGPEGSVSGEVAIGLLTPEGRRLIGPVPHTELQEEAVSW